MIIKRALESEIRSMLGQGKAIVIYGARQVGKTTLLHQIFGTPESALSPNPFDQDPDQNSDQTSPLQASSPLWLNGDLDSTRQRFESLTPDTAASIIGSHRTVIIDEAQRIPDIGLKLKILQDAFGREVQFVVTGSSSFELANQISEPMTGRIWQLQLHPLMLSELVEAHGSVAELGALPQRLIYGSYPDVVTHPQFAERIISGLSQENLYRDVLNLSEVIKTDGLRKILQALAFQIGSQVSLNEIAQLVSLDRKTVDRYISLLEQAFIIFRLPSYGKNLRNELKSSQKIYFYDIGIRNALIDDFRPLDARQDIGNVFENYIVSEIKKQTLGRLYFWRTTQQQEVDLVIETAGSLRALEIKWNEKKSSRLPSTFVDTYRPVAEYHINRQNYLDELPRLLS